MLAFPEPVKVTWRAKNSSRWVNTIRKRMVGRVAAWDEIRADTNFPRAA
jgi:hypothetical protein